ncbi:MAG: aminotransferase class I/II-fold pyridoxal phosphate-dependent enzyme [Bacteroidales bacterium]|nr:aminotransferase class I/II-fold pyridoxal phosphate-dependent enzyme [Bacteroidales bacterium]
MNDIELKYKTEIAKYLKSSSNDIFLYWKGRVALFAILKAMDIQKDDEVILPAFTCVVVPNAIKYLGAKPIYVDIDATTYNFDLSQLKSKITDKTKVIICQNTFGLSSNVEKVVAIAKEYGLKTVEDCTHGFGGTYQGKPNGSYCDAAFYSTQWNKPYSTGVGGFALVTDPDLKDKLEKVNADLEPATFKDKISLSTLYFVREKILTDRRYWRMVKLYRWLSKHKLVQGSSSGTEIESTQMPSHYFKGMSTTQMKKGIVNLKTLDEMMSLRMKNAEIYTDYLKSNGKTFIPAEQFTDHSFLKYPFLVKERETVMRIAEENKIPLGEWFCSPIHPVMEHFDQWDFCECEFPVATKYSSEMLNLPTDVKDTAPVLAFLDKINEFLL